METLLQDLRYAVRAMGRIPGYTLLAVLALSIGIGATTAVFTLTHAVLLRPLPVPEPDRLVNVEQLQEGGTVAQSFSLPEYVAYRDRADAGGFTGLVAHHLSDISLRTGAEAQVALAADVSGNYFDVLGIRPALGRFFDRAEARADVAAPVAVLSHDVWRQRFGGEESVLGRTIHVNGVPLTVIGVAPQGFHGAMLGAEPPVWLPIGLYERLHPGTDVQRSGRTWLQLFGRLAPGVAAERAAAALTVTARQLAQLYDYPDDAEPVGVRVPELSALPPRIRDAAAGFMVLLLTTAALVLLIATVNVAGMLLARANVRRREFAIRLAIGAGRRRLVRQLLTESVLLSGLGGAAGLLLTLWVADVLERVRPPGAGAFRLDLSLDPAVFGFAAAVSIVAGILFGLAPALQATRRGVVPGLRNQASGDGGGTRFRSGLVTGQIALSLLLLIAAGLFVRTLQSALATEHGFEPGGVVAVELDLRLNGYDEARGHAFYTRLLERVRGLPGVRAASVATVIPLGLSWDQTRARVPGFESPPGEPGFRVLYNIVSTDYFETLRMPLLAGRGFEAADAGGPRVAVINEAFARRFWPRESPMGQRFQIAGEDVTVVGVVPAGKYRAFDEESMLYAYFPFGPATYTPGLWLQVRGSGGLAPLVAGIRQELRALDPDVPPIAVTTVDEVMKGSLFPQRMAAALVGAFGLIGLTLSAIGVFALLSFSVAQRRREIGIRMALGARRPHVIALVLRHGLMLTGAGVALGLAAAIPSTRLLGGLLHGVSATDPVTFVGVPLLLGAVAALATFAPARRASRVDPMVMLREE